MTLEQATTSDRRTGTDVNSASKKVRPLIICDSSTTDKYRAALRHLLFGLEAQDIVSSLAVEPDSEIEKLLWPSVNKLDYPVMQFGLFGKQNLLRLVEQAERFQPTVIHCLGTKRLSAAKHLQQALGIPLVVSLYSSRLNFFQRRRLHTGISRIIAADEKNLALLKKQLPKISEHIKYVATGTFVDETCSCFSDTCRLASLIAVCDFDNFQKIEPLLSAIRHLAVDGAEFMAVLMGSGKALRDIRRFILGTGLSSTVSICPVIHPLRSVFRGADIFIQPTAADGLAPALLEAAAAGLAIACDSQNADRMLQNNQTAVFFDSTDELSIYSSLNKLLSNHTFSIDIAKAMQEHLRTHNSVSAMIEELLEIYTGKVDS